ncbi:hypothetical protein ACHAWF_012496 [Thalassiosira exigua]
MSAADRLSLERRLADLMGISVDDDRDYVTDVLDSLSGDPDDVVEYLSSFVSACGEDGGGDEVRRFAKDLKRFKQGEAISSAENRGDDDASAAAFASEAAEAKPRRPKVLDEAAVQRDAIKRREMEAREKQREEQERLLRKKEDEEQKRRRAEETVAANRKKPPEVKKAGVGGSAQNANIQSSGQKSGFDAEQHGPTSMPTSKGTSVKTSKPERQKAKKKQQHKRPQKGKPRKDPCGCFGNKHKPLTNCLRCGRISCEAEGVDDYCHFCGHFVEDFSEIVATGDEKADSALRHKERLLEFDRTSAARTRIHDDQEDYFVTSTSMWATEAEREDAREMEEERRKKLHARQKQALNLNF